MSTIAERLEKLVSRRELQSVLSEAIYGEEQPDQYLDDLREAARKAEDIRQGASVSEIGFHCVHPSYWSVAA